LREQSFTPAPGNGIKDDQDAAGLCHLAA